MRHALTPYSFSYSAVHFASSCKVFKGLKQFVCDILWPETRTQVTSAFPQVRFFPWGQSPVRWLETWCHPHMKVRQQHCADLLWGFAPLCVHTTHIVSDDQCSDLTAVGRTGLQMLQLWLPSCDYKTTYGATWRLKATVWIALIQTHAINLCPYTDFYSWRWKKNICPSCMRRAGGAAISGTSGTYELLWTLPCPFLLSVLLFFEFFPG